MTFEEKKQEFIEYLIGVIETLEGGKNKKNATHLREKFESMNEQKFINYFRKFFKDEDMNLTLNVEPGEDNLCMKDIIKAAKKADVELFDNIALPYLSKDANNPIITQNKIMTGYINGRRLQQRVRKKNSTSISISKRDPRYNQVTGEDKIGRITDWETRALEVQGAKSALKEFFGPRSDDSVSKEQMYQSIIEKGTVSLKDLDISKFNKQSLITANDFFIAAMVGNDLLTREYLLPRTLKYGKKDATGLKRGK